MTRRSVSALAMALALIVPLAPAAHASSSSASASVALPAAVRAEVNNSQLQGQGSYRWFGLKLYDARLWVEAGTFLPQSPLDTAFALELRYARTLSGERIAQASHAELERLGFGTPAQRARWLERMRQVFPDVREGTRLTGVHAPGRGAVFFLNESRMAEIADPEFAHAFFSIWLDARTADPALRAALLGKAE